MELPLASVSLEQRELLLAPSQSDEGIERLSGKRVLLAEDNALNAEIAMELIQSIGLETDWVENGALAVEKLESSELGTYYAVFMDMQMPVMDGVEAAEGIRSGSHADHDIPIIAMTVNTFEADKQQCRVAGMTGFISKPINPDAIASALLKI